MVAERLTAVLSVIIYGVQGEGGIPTQDKDELRLMVNEFNSFKFEAFRLQSSLLSGMLITSMISLFDVKCGFQAAEGVSSEKTSLEMMNGRLRRVACVRNKIR